MPYPLLAPRVESPSNSDRPYFATDPELALCKTADASQMQPLLMSYGRSFLSNYTKRFAGIEKFEIKSDLLKTSSLLKQGKLDVVWVFDLARWLAKTWLPHTAQ